MFPSSVRDCTLWGRFSHAWSDWGGVFGMWRRSPHSDTFKSLGLVVALFPSVVNNCALWVASAMHGAAGHSSRLALQVVPVRACQGGAPEGVDNRMG